MNEQDYSAYTPMMRQYLEIKKDYNDAIVFFRLGDFYEMFFKDAYIASKELELQLTGRDAGVKERVPMCGVPHHAAQTYIERLIQKGYKVAICEQVEDPSKTKKLVKRDVVRLITPGTYMEHSVDDFVYLCSLGIHANAYTIAYADLSTGDTYSMRIPKDYHLLKSELLQIRPKEVIVGNSFDHEHILSLQQAEGFVVSIEPQVDVPNVFSDLVSPIPTKEEKRTFFRLLRYVISTQKRNLMHLKPATLLESRGYLHMDAGTLRNLELFETLRSGNRIGSLFWLLDKCETALGSRYLKQQLQRPIVNRVTLETRYDMIDTLNREFIIKQELKELLKQVYDLERIVGRISYGNTNAKDLVQLRRSLSVLPEFQEKLSLLGLSHAQFLSDSIDPLTNLFQLLQDALVDDPPLTIKEGGIIKEGYNNKLDELRYASTNVKDWLTVFRDEQREKTGIKTLKVGYNRVFGYYIEVPKGQIQNIKEEYGYIRKQTLANSERYITEELKEKETFILSSEEKIVQLEYELFIMIRDEAKQHISQIQKNARIISEVDMLIALSYVSEIYRLTRPVLNEDNTIRIIESRHPVVEQMLDGDAFVPNDIVMDAHADILLITGPNMSGKSTYMRQMAITAILAQIGSFIPAKEAHIPVFDAIFTRIGAADDLVSGKSTFMIEMMEANHAIQNATKNSLILFDELGRGTATYDGMALAQAIIEYIHEKIHAKTMFSTHYHELTDLDKTLNKLRNVHVSAKDQDGSILFLHKVKEGPTDKSYGIHVAALAHLPKGLIERAKQILSSLEKTHSKMVDTDAINLFNFDDFEEEKQETAPSNEIRQLLEGVDVNELTPLQALNLLAQIMTKI